MTSPSVPSPEASGLASSGAVDTRLRGPLLPVARAAWLVAALTTVALFVVSLPAELEYFRTPCFGALCGPDALTPERLEVLQALGFSPNSYATYLVTLSALFGLVYLAVSVVIFTRKSDDWLAMFVALALLTFGMASWGIWDQAWLGRPVVLAIVEAAQFVGYLSIVTFFCIFPNGRFVPRWSVGLPVAYAIFTAPFALLPDSPANPDNWPSPWSSLALLFYLGIFVAGLYAQVYRYRRASTPVERQQTKWVVYGVAVALGGFVALILLFYELDRSLQQNLLATVAGLTAAYLLMLLIGLSIGIAILRSRLWDIDVVINRTLVYGALTAILAGLYSASVVLSQRIFVAVTGSRSDAEFVLATLVVAAAFTPVRTHLQRLVDGAVAGERDPAKELAAFTEQVQKLSRFVRLEQLNVEGLARQFLDEATAAYGAKGGALRLGSADQPKLEYVVGSWEGTAELSVPLEAQGMTVGWLELGARRNRTPYRPDDKAALEQAATVVASLVRPEVTEPGR